MKIDPKVERIIEWRESFSSLPDDYFFDIIHIYLGEIKTPYNKPKLIEELGTILRKKENRETLVNYLDEKDVRILTAIKFIPEVDIEKLEKFFVPAMSQGDLYEEIASLEERLIIYNRENKLTGKKTIALNPHLEEDLEAVLDLGNLVAEEEGNFIREDTGIFISPGVIAVFVSYILAHPDFCKSNGDLKKKTDSDLREICGIESTEIFQKLFLGMRNLVLVQERDDGKGWDPDWERLETFSQLPFKSQVIYLCVAAAGNFSRRVLVSNADFFSRTLDFAAGKYFTKEKLFAISFLIREKSGTEDLGGRRFARILAAAGDSEEHMGLGMIESMIASAVAFGIMNPCGTNADGIPVFYVDNRIFSEVISENKKLLSVDNGYSVTIMPGLSLEELLSLVKFLDVTGCDITCSFEIKRQSIMRGFDLGLTKKSIVEILEKFSSFTLPQNLLVSLDEWDQTYGSAFMYKGYVLKLSEENIFRAENNPVFKTHVVETLAPGVYLLDFENDGQFHSFMVKTGIDFAGKIHSVKKHEEIQGWPSVSSGARKDSLVFQGIANKFQVNKKLCGTILENFKSHLETMDVTRDQKDGLLYRISRRVVIEDAQLRPESVRFELMEAFGMNYTGKLHVLESAIQKNSLVEIELTGSESLILGIPKGILKNAEVPVVFLSIENKDTNETREEEIEIAKIARVRRIRNSLSLRRQ